MLKRLTLFIVAILAGMFVMTSMYHPPMDFEAVDAQVAPQVVLPNDVVSQAKFRGVDKDYINAVSALNQLVNRSITYVEDEVQYGKAEWFVMMPESSMGDCEDYALSKMYLLGQVKFPTVTHARLVSVVVKAKDGTFYGHMVLEVLLPDGSAAILDNRFDHLMTRRELVANEGYRFQNW